MTKTHHQWAMEYIQQGLTPFPIRLVDQGARINKEPTVKWKNFTADDAKALPDTTWLTGVGLKCGEASGNLYCIDYDVKNDLQGHGLMRFRKAVQAAGIEKEFSSCFVQTTISGGKHFIYRVADSPGGNKKFARNQGDDRYFLESRGEGGYIAVFPSYLTNQKKYKIQGNSIKVPVLSVEAHKKLLEAAVSADEGSVIERLKTVSERDYSYRDTQDIQAIIKASHQQGRDLTGSYADWFQAAAALESAFGEEGRRYFHELSRIHPEYDASKADDQYTQALNHVAQGKAVSMGTLIAMADAQLPGWRMELPKMDESSLPMLTDAQIEKLPGLVRQILSQYDGNKRKTLAFFGLMAGLGQVFPNVRIRDGKNLLSLNNFFYLVGPPSSGKGEMSTLKKYFSRIAQDFDTTLPAVEEGEKEPETMPDFFLASDSSGSGLVETLCANNGRGLMVEEESEAMASSWGSEWGAMASVLFRKAFHSEGHKMKRRTSGLEKIDETRFSAVITSTLAPFKKLLGSSSAENGLYSRLNYLFIASDTSYRERPKKSQFLARGLTVEDEIDQIAMALYALYRKNRSEEVTVCYLSDQTTDMLNDVFREAYNELDERYKGQSGKISQHPVYSALRSYRNRARLSAERWAFILALIRTEGSMGNFQGPTAEEMENVLSIFREIVLEHAEIALRKAFVDLPYMDELKDDQYWDSEEKRQVKIEHQVWHVLNEDHKKSTRDLAEAYGVSQSTVTQGVKRARKLHKDGMFSETERAFQKQLAITALAEKFIKPGRSKLKIAK